MKVNVEELTSLDNDSKILYEKSKKQNWKIEKCERYSSGIVGEEKQNMSFTSSSSNTLPPTQQAKHISPASYIISLSNSSQ